MYEDCVDGCMGIGDIVYTMHTFDIVDAVDTVDTVHTVDVVHVVHTLGTLSALSAVYTLVQMGGRRAGGRRAAGGGRREVLSCFILACPRALFHPGLSWGSLDDRPKVGTGSPIY